MSSQGGWNPSLDPLYIHPDLESEIDQAFSNVELALKVAGCKGWSQVYSVRSFHIPADEATLALMAKSLKKWCGPEQRPIFTMIGVTSLADARMRVEIEVEAFDS